MARHGLSAFAALTIMILAALPHRLAEATPTITNAFAFTDYRPANDPFFSGYYVSVQAFVSDPGGVPTNVLSVFGQNAGTGESRTLFFSGGEATIFPGPYSRWLSYNESRLGVWQITAQDKVGNSTTRLTHDLDKPVQLKAPTNISIQNAANGGQTVSFQAVSGADSYGIEIFNNKNQGIYVRDGLGTTIPIPAGVIVPGGSYKISIRANDFDTSEPLGGVSRLENRALGWYQYTAGVTVPKPTPLAPTPKDFGFPLRNLTNSYALVTEAGGESSDSNPPAYRDNFHTDTPTQGGYYSLDFKSVKPGDTNALVAADVVSAAAGVVVQVASSKANNGPVVTIYHGDGYFTEYREFDAPLVTLGQQVSKGTPIGTYTPGSNGSDGDRATHFQIKYNKDFTIACAGDCYTSYSQSAALFSQSHNQLPPYHRDLKLSSESITQIEKATLAGIPLKGYQLIPGDGIVRTALPFSIIGGKALFTTAVSLSSFNTYNTSISGQTATLSEGSPAFLWSDISIPLDALFLLFEYEWAAIGDGDYLSVFFDSELIFSSLGSDFLSDDFLQAMIPIFQFAGQTGQLLFALNSVGEPNAELQIRNLGFATVPEPASIALLAAGAFGLYRARRSRRRPKRRLRMPF